MAILSGLTDMDAITLSTAQLVSSARLDADHGWRVIVLASLANLVFKSLIVVALGATPFAFPHRTVVWSGVAGRGVDSVALASGYVTLHLITFSAFRICE